MTTNWYNLPQKVDQLLALCTQIAKTLGLEEAQLLTILKEEKKMVESTDDIVAKITAETTVLNSVQAAVTGLSEGHATIEDEIKDLKAQIAAGQPADFTKIDAAIANQDTVINSLATAIPANTPAAPG